MTKEQKKIYVWLMSKPGYCKKSADGISIPYWNVSGREAYASIEDCEVALKHARRDLKLGVSAVNTTTERKSLKTHKNTIKREYNYVSECLDTKPYIKPLKSYSNDNVLVIPDTHFPFEKEGILEHCLNMRDKYKCGTIVHIGDEVDLCGVSQWEKDPDGFSPGTEAHLAQEKMKIWYKAFPEVYVCIGNHTARPFRQAKTNGIPKKFIKSYEEAWEAPKGWRWSDSWEINNVHYTHGTGFSGPNAAIRIATRHRQNTVIGHIHSEAGIQYSASKIDLVWGMQVGGSLDDKAYAAFYAKDQLKKSIVGCGIVLGGKLPIYEPMSL